MLLTHRKLLQSKAIAIENDLRGTLRNFGLKVGMVGKVKFERGGENDNKRDRWVDLYVGADGSARLSRHDLRPSLKEDYEYHVNVPAAAVPKLVFALLREKYLGRSDAVQEFREFCEKEGIELWW
jgi:hypothetical protein